MGQAQKCSRGGRKSGNEVKKYKSSKSVPHPLEVVKLVVQKEYKQGKNMVVG